VMMELPTVLTYLFWFCVPVPRPIVSIHSPCRTVVNLGIAYAGSASGLKALLYAMVANPARVRGAPSKSERRALEVFES